MNNYIQITDYNPCDSKKSSLSKLDYTTYTERILLGISNT